MIRHRTPNGVLLQGDCLEIMPKLKTDSIDMILCDLPYGTTACKWDTVIPFEPLWAEYKRLIKPNGAIVLTASQPFTSALVMSNVASFKYSWVWHKNKATGHLNANLKPMLAHEDIVVFSFGKPAYNPQKTNGHKPGNKATRCSSPPTVYNEHTSTEYGGQTDRFPRSVIDVPVVNNDGTGDGRFHPTQKPVALFEYLIKTYTHEGMVVLDNCAGSGTTAVACENLKRKWCCIEREEKYCDVIVDRLSKI